MRLIDTTEKSFKQYVYTIKDINTYIISVFLQEKGFSVLKFMGILKVRTNKKHIPDIKI